MYSPETAEGGPGFVPSMKDRAAIAAALWELPPDGRWNLGLVGAEDEFWFNTVWTTLDNLPSDSLPSDNFPSDVNCDERAAIAAALCVEVSLAPTEELGVRRLCSFCYIQTVH